ncbi:hypothetical protein ACFL3D_02735 [Candidatus Omnitrophota bacterium]
MCKRSARFVFIVFASFFILSLSKISAENVTYEFEDDRDITNISNVRHVESRSVYTTRQIKELKEDMAILQNDIITIKELVESDEGGPAETPEDLKSIVNKLSARLDEFYVSLNEVIESQNELMENVEDVLSDDYSGRLERIEKQIKTIAQVKQIDTNNTGGTE